MWGGVCTLGGGLGALLGEQSPLSLPGSGGWDRGLGGEGSARGLCPHCVPSDTATAGETGTSHPLEMTLPAPNTHPAGHKGQKEPVWH